MQSLCPAPLSSEEGKEMSLETDPTKINDADRQLEQTIFTVGGNYAARGKRAKEEAKARKEDRDRIEARGINPNAFHVVAGQIKKLTPKAFKAWLADVNYVAEVMARKQADLFPEDQAAALKREQLREQKAAEIPRDSKALDEKTDTDKRSDPNKGGAKPKPPSTSGKPALTVAGGTDVTPPPVPDDEQKEGEAALNAGLAQTNAAGKPKSQSQIAKEKLEAAKL